MSQGVKSILCFGDSNTFGFNPTTRGRYPRDIRWTGRLQLMLGQDYLIIEDGLNSRTTVWEDPRKDFRDGRKTLPLALELNQPLDLVIISLGANDTKTLYNQPAPNIATGLEALIRVIKDRPWSDIYPEPRILVVSPPLITESAYTDKPFSAFDASSVEKSRELAGLFRLMCDFYKVDFIDGAEITPVGPDGLHLDPLGHERMAQRMCEYILGIWPEEEVE